MRLPARSEAVTAAPGQPLSSRELRARQLVDALATADALRQKLTRYQTTADWCGCPDFQMRGIARDTIDACKHILAYRLLAERETHDARTNST